jgi:DhnA family fructose-bisphosphate aldolase class Ia
MFFFKKKINQHIFIPADVPSKKHAAFVENYAAITHNTDRLLLFSADQKIEHLNKDFYGKGISLDDNDPEHLFRIASQGSIGALATQFGLIARYGSRCKTVNYIVKMNSKTNLVSSEQRDPLSRQLWTIDQIMHCKNDANLLIRGIGYTIYLGSAFEAKMLHEAAQLVYNAHQEGLIAILWMYPRGKGITNQFDGELIAGAAGVAHALGADFAKINPPHPSNGKTSEQWLQIAVQAAGNTKLLCSGGQSIDPTDFLQTVFAQLHEGGVSGCAIGRNIHQKPLKEAIAFTYALSEIVYKNQSVANAEKHLITSR